MTEGTINGVKIHHYTCVDSTNKIALDASDAPHLLTVVSDRQTGGRGRMGRRYFSYDGGLYMSVVLRTSEIKIPYHLCTPAAALAVKKALSECGISGVEIKWVNDLLKEDRKICGILTESRSEIKGIDRIVVGIGINLTKPEDGFPEEIKTKAGYAEYEGDKMTLAAEIVKKLDELIKYSRSEIITEYDDNMTWKWKSVTVTDYADGNKKVNGIIIGVNENCFLKIRLPDGSEKLLSSGEIIY